MKMVWPNSDQWTSILRTVLKITGTVLVARGTIGEAGWEQLSGAVIVIAPIIWDLFVHSDNGKLKAVEAMKDVKIIEPVANPDPQGAVAEAAKDITRTKVVLS